MDDQFKERTQGCFSHSLNPVNTASVAFLNPARKKNTSHAPSTNASAKFQHQILSYIPVPSSTSSTSLHFDRLYYLEYA